MSNAVAMTTLEMKSPPLQTPPAITFNKALQPAVPSQFSPPYSVRFHQTSSNTTLSDIQNRTMIMKASASAASKGLITSSRSWKTAASTMAARLVLIVL